MSIDERLLRQAKPTCAGGGRFRLLLDRDPGQGVDRVALAARLTDLGEDHAGVHFATIGWILPMLHDPDGHEVRFYTIQHHTQPGPDDVHVVEVAVGTSKQRELDYQARS